MWNVVKRRLLSAIPILLLVSVIVFVLVDFAPGDAATSLAGDNPTPERVAQIRTQLHLDDPLVVRYGRWLNGVAHGNLGDSLQTKEPVLSMIAPRAAVTASLVLVALVFAITTALVLGIIASLRPRGLLDRAITAAASVGIAIPPFWLGLILVVAFAVHRTWFPAIGYKSPSAGVGTWLQHLVLPALALSLFLASEMTLQVKNALSDVLERDFILAGEARGLSRASILLKHGLKNAAAPVVTVLGFRLAALLGGTVTIETVFVLPGLGILAVNSVLGRDIPVLLGLVILSAALVIVINLLVDISYGYFDPKVRG